jgi:tRNA G37 N-methylase Trm5
MNVSIRLLAVTRIATSINCLEKDIESETGSDGKVLQHLRDVMFEILHSIYYKLETQEERDEYVKSATQAIKSAGWTKYKFSVVNDRFYIIPDKDVWG